MKKRLFHAKRRNKSLSKQKILLSLKHVKKATNKPTGRRINADRIDPSKVHAERILFNEQHFGCKTFHHQNGEKSWVVPVSKKETPAVTIKRILQIIVPSEFFYVTDKSRKKTVYKRDVYRRVISVEETTVNITAHAENAVKEMLLKEGINMDFIMTKKNVCYVTLHKQASEEKIRNLFPTLHMRVFKVKN